MFRILKYIMHMLVVNRIWFCVVLHRYSTARAIVIGLICTFFDFFNIPVFWPILVIYFITLFAFTMKKQIQVCVHCSFYRKTVLGITDSFQCLHCLIMYWVREQIRLFVSRGSV
jgi:hypothetical protein